MDHEGQYGNYDNFLDEFSSSFSAGDIPGANASIMKEMGRMLATRREDYVNMLNQSGVYADETMSDGQLIDLLVHNLPSNKKLALGSSVLLNMNNKRSGFDGQEKVDDAAVKSSYFTLREHFSPIGGLGAIGGVLQAGAGLAGKIIDNKRAKKSGISDALAKQKDAKSQIIQQALKIKQEQAKAQTAQQNAAIAKSQKDAKIKKTLIIGGSVLVGLVILIGGIVYIRKHKK